MKQVENIRQERQHSCFRKDMAMLLVLACLSIAMLSTLISKGQWYYGAQAYRYLYLLESFRQAVDAGLWYPRWVPDLMGGYGYPTFVFYQPGFFFLSLPFTYLFSNTAYALAAALACMLTLGAMGMYYAAKQLTRPLAAGASAILFLLTPYIPFMLYARGSLSELLGVLVCPWVLYFMLRMQDEWGRSQITWTALFGLSVSTALLIISHPIVAAYALPSLVIVMFANAQSLRFGFIRLVILCILLALVLCSAYWVPLLQLYNAVDWGRAHRIVTMQWSQLFFLGSGHGLLAVFLFARRPIDKWILVMGGWMAFLLFLLGPLGYAIWGHLLWADYTAMLQMTYRVLGVMAVLFALVIARGLAGTSMHPVPSYMVVLLSVGALMLSYGTTNQPQDFLKRRLPAELFSYHKAASLFSPAVMHDIRRLPKGWRDTTWIEDTPGFQQKIRTTTNNMTHTDEFYPLTASRNPLPNRFNKGIPAAVGPFITLATSEIAPYRISLEQNVPEGVLPQPPVIINQYAFAGWRIMINGMEASDKAWHITKEGLIAVNTLTAGKRHISAWYDGPPRWKWRNMILFLVAFVIIAYMKHIIRITNRVVF